MQAGCNHFEPKRRISLRVSTRFAFGLTFLLSVLLCAQACRSAPPDVQAEKDQVVAALDTLVTNLVADRPVATNEYSQRLTTYLEAHPTFYGAAAAILDEERNVVASPYVYRTTGGFQTLDLATPDYDIENQEWFSEPLTRDEAIWTSPYFDVGGGEIWMITHAVPARDEQGTFAIITTDLPTEDPTN